MAEGRAKKSPVKPTSNQEQSISKKEASRVLSWELEDLEYQSNLIKSALEAASETCFDLIFVPQAIGENEITANSYETACSLVRIAMDYLSKMNRTLDFLANDLPYSEAVKA